MQLSHLASGGGVLVTEVAAGSPAERAGISARDIIVKLGESVVGSVDDLHALLTDERIGRRETVVLLRDGVTRTVDVEPREQPPAR
jgi:S1-C subfamily serine protease